MKVISDKGGDLLAQFDNVNEIDIPVLEKLVDLPPQIRDILQQKMLIENHIDANREKIKGYSFLENVFGFCKTF